jgi:glutaminyl-peptide cyclotransferase
MQITSSIYKINSAKRAGNPKYRTLLGKVFLSRISSLHVLTKNLKSSLVRITAVLLELARTLAPEKLPIQIVFFDAEDNGGINGREWIMGSSAFVAQMSYLPRAVVIIDMVGDADLNIFIERNSSSDIVAEIWGQAAKLGFSDQFIQTQKYSMMDDHTPFLEAGIMAVDIIDFDYPFWHTSADTPDKVSPESLQIVGETLLEWITSQE